MKTLDITNLSILKECQPAPFGLYLEGVLENSQHPRFSNGELISTSDVRSVEEYKNGYLVRTLNSLYFVEKTEFNVVEWFKRAKIGVRVEGYNLKSV